MPTVPHSSILWMASAPVAFAQDEAVTGEIIVTAQRRSESLQKVPVSVTALSSETLASRNANDLSQITRAAPTLQVGIDNSFAVRGVDQTLLRTAVRTGFGADDRPGQLSWRKAA